MDSTAVAFNSVDYFVLFVFGLSMLAGYIRGFLKEVISLITWVAASVVATLFSNKLAPFFSGIGSQVAQNVSGGTSETINQSVSMMSIGASFVTLFIGTMFAGFIVKTLIVGLASGMADNLTNRFLGAFFGGLRGFVVVIVLMFIAELTPMGAQPNWNQSQFVQSFHPIVAWLDKMVHPQLNKIREKAESAVQGVSGSMQGITDQIQGGVSGAVSGALKGANP